MKTKFILFFILFILTPSASKAAVVINEIAWMGTTIDYNDEWIELYNPDSQAVDLTGWVLEAMDGAPKINLSGSIAAESYFLLERTDDNSMPGIPADQIYSGALGNSGEDLKLKDNTGNIIDDLNFISGWPAGDNTTKQTLERIAADWQTSLDPGGTPKAQNSSGVIEESESTTEEPESTAGEPESTTENPTTPTFPAGNQPPIADAGNNVIAFIDEEVTFDGSKSYDPDGLDLAYEWNLGEGGVENDVVATHKYSFPGTYLVTLMVFDGRYYVKDTITVEIYPKKITINEFLPNPEGQDAEEEWIELYNDSDQIIDISGWQLDDEDGGSRPFVFPENTLIAPKSYIVFSRPTTDIALNNDKGRVRLLLSTGVVFQEISYEKAPKGLSSARTPEGFAWSVATPGLPNIVGIDNKEISFNASVQSETTKHLSKDVTLNYQNDSKDQIQGGWAYLPQQNSLEKSPENTGNLIANLSQITEKSNSRLILIILTIIIAALAIGIGVMKLKKK